MEKLLNVSETAEFLGLKESTIRSWILNRRIKYVKMGSRVFVRQSDAQEFIESSVVYPNEQQAA